MAVDCCKLVQNLNIGDFIISVQVRSSTEVNKSGNSILVGPTIGSISMTGYATDVIHYGCPGRAGVTINWIRKYDCDNDQVYMLFAGSGKSYISGDVEGTASVLNPVVTYPIINASAANGPTGLYEDYNQTDGYGLDYTGFPYPFTTTDEGSVSIGNLGNFIGNSPSIYLQSFSVQFSPGEVPVASYDLVFINNND